MSDPTGNPFVGDDEVEGGNPFSGNRERVRRPRGYRTPEQIKRLNKIDVQRAKEEGQLGPWETIAGGLGAAVQGRTFGFADEIAAGLRAPFQGKGYGEALKGVREEQGIFAKEYPKADIALNIAGGAMQKAPFAGQGIKTGLKNALAIGIPAGIGYADEGASDLRGKIEGAGKGGAAAVGLTALLGGAGALGRGAGAVARKVLASPQEKALDYLRKLAATRGGIPAVEADVLAARVAGGQPILAEGIGETGVRALEATTKAPLSQAGEVARGALAARGATVLPRAEQAALGTVGSQGLARGTGEEAGRTALRGPQYLNDWIEAIRKDATVPGYLRAAAEAAAKEGAPGKASARFEELLAIADMRALPAPGQSVAAKAGLPDMREGISFPGVPKRVPTETVSQEMARTALEGRPAQARLEEQGGRRIVHGPTDVGVRGPEFVPEAVAPKVPVRSAVDEAVTLTRTNRLARNIHSSLLNNPDKAAVVKDPTTYDAIQELYHATNARIRDIAGSSEKNTNDKRALQAIAKRYYRALGEIAPSSEKANKLFAQLSQPKESMSLGREFDKLSPEELDKVIQTGFLPDGTLGNIESVRLGVVERLREMLVKRAGSQALAGDAKVKGTLGVMNSEQLNRQLLATLGDKFDKMVLTIRQLLREEGTRMSVSGGKEGLVPEGANIADIVGAFGGGLGFGMQAAARRGTLSVAKGNIQERIAAGIGKGADARAKMLTATDRALDDWLNKAARPRVVPWEAAATRAPQGRLTRGLLSGIFSGPNEAP